jgi:hypothetical protein
MPPDEQIIFQENQPLEKYKILRNVKVFTIQEILNKLYAMID